MRSLDTNILARWLLGDDPAQASLAESLLGEAGWISHTVLLELGWVLHKSLRLPRETVADMFEQILALDTVVVAQFERMSWAVSRYRAGADWGDVMHLVTSSAEVEAFTTFDLKLARLAGVDSPIPIETLRI